MACRGGLLSHGDIYFSMDMVNDGPLHLPIWEVGEKHVHFR